MMSAVPPPSPASRLLQGLCKQHSICVQHKPLWERACARWGHQQHHIDYIASPLPLTLPRMHCYKAAPLIRALSQATPQSHRRDWQLASCTRQFPRNAALRPSQPVLKHSPLKLAQTLQHPHQAHREHSRVGSPLGQRRSIGRRGRGQQRQAGHSSPAASQTNRQRRLEPQGFRRFFLAFEQ